jgi:hypothetical protein
MATNSQSVVMPARRHKRAKKKTVRIPPNTMFHHNQLPAMPFWATSSVTANGVSAAKVVATMLVPAMYHGRLRPVRKKSPMLRPARFDKKIPIEMLRSRYKAIMIQSNEVSNIPLD